MRRDAAQSCHLRPAAERAGSLTPEATPHEAAAGVARTPRFRRGEWRALAANQLERLRDELEAVEAVGPPNGQEPELFEARKRIVQKHLGRAEEAMAPVGLVSLLRNWYSGAAIETVWASLHRASETLLLIQPAPSLASELADIGVAFETSLGSEDPRRTDLAKPLAEARKILFEEQRPDKVTDTLRSKLVAARRAANIASDTAHSAVRKWRNALVVAGFAVSVLALGVAVVHAIVPDFLSLAPGERTNGGRTAEPWEVELVGALGGAVAALLALNRFAGFTDPYGLPTAQALLRIPMAAVTGLVGVLLMQTAALDILEPQTGSSVLAYAFVFGYAQEPLLRLIDRQAGDVLDPARDKNEPASRPRQVRERPTHTGERIDRATPGGGHGSGETPES